MIHSLVRQPKGLRLTSPGRRLCEALGLGRGALLALKGRDFLHLLYVISGAARFVSIPNISFIKRHIVLDEERAKLVLKTLCLMMLFLFRKVLLD